MNVPLYNEAIAHFFAGISVAIGDRYFSNNASRHTERRKAQLTDQVASLSYLREFSQRPLTPESAEEAQITPDYRIAIEKARQYFTSQGKPVRSQREGLISGLVSKISNAKGNERFNLLSWQKLLGTAFAVEFVADVGVAVGQVTSGRGDGVAAVAETLYQGPAFFTGLLAGRGVLAVKDMFRSEEEKMLRGKAKELVNDGVIYTMVRDYKPLSLTPLKEVESTTSGPVIAEVTEKAANIIGREIGGIRSRLNRRAEEKEKAERERKEEISKRFEDY